VLDSNSANEVYGSEPNKGPYQKWTFVEDNDSYRLANTKTFGSLDSAANGKVYTLLRNDGMNQQWQFVEIKS